MGSTVVQGLDVARIRGLYPTVAAGAACLDGPLSQLQPESVIRAIVATLRSSPTQPGSTSSRSRRTAASVQQTRRAFADLVGGAPDSVLLGPTVAALHLHFTELLTRDWRLGDQIVLSRLDSDAVLTPWLRAARATGGSVRWAEVDLETGELPVWQYEQLLTPHTRLVTVPLGNPATGTVPDVRAIADLAHAVGAVVLVDAGAAAAHVPLDIEALGADIVTFDAASFGGPSLAASVARPQVLTDSDGAWRSPSSRSALSSSSTSRSSTSRSSTSRSSFTWPSQSSSTWPSASARLGFGPLPVELLDGAVAAVDHLAALEEDATGSRRERLASSVTVAGTHTSALWSHFAERVADLPHVTVFGGTGPRLPMLAFAVRGRQPTQVGEFLDRRGVSVWTGPADMTQLIRAFGADEHGGATFAGFMPHTTFAEVDALLAGLAALG